MTAELDLSIISEQEAATRLNKLIGILDNLMRLHGGVEDIVFLPPDEAYERGRTLGKYALCYLALRKAQAKLENDDANWPVDSA